MSLLAFVACAVLGAGSSAPPADLHVQVEYIDKLSEDPNLAPQCNLYRASECDLAFKFKITRADPDHPGHPAGSVLYLAVSRYFFEATLEMQRPPVELEAGRRYDLRLKKSAEGSRWNYELKAL